MIYTSKQYVYHCSVLHIEVNHSGKKVGQTFAVKQMYQ